MKYVINYSQYNQKMQQLMTNQPFFYKPVTAGEKVFSSYFRYMSLKF